MLNFDIETFEKLNNVERFETFLQLKKHLPDDILDIFFFKMQDIKNPDIGQSIYVTHLTTNQNLQTAYSLFNKDSFHTSEELGIFKNIITSLAFVNSALKPLSQVLEIEYEIGLVGGALRDFILGKKELIKDLDIVFALQDIKGFSHPKLKEDNFKWMIKENDISQERKDKMTQEEYLDELNNIPNAFSLNAIWANEDFLLKELGIPKFIYDESQNTTKIEQFFFFIVKELLEKQFTIDKAYPPRPIPKTDNVEAKAEIWRSGYNNAFLRGVVKVSSPVLKYPVDILLCNNSVETYLSTFDFEICKASITYKETESDRLDSLLNFFTLEKLEHEYEKITVTHGFINDAQNKTLTLNPIGFDLNAVEEALLKHYPRIKEKYNDYEFNPNVKVWEKIVLEEIKEYVLKFIDYEQLNKKIASKEESKEMKKQVRNKI